MTRARPHSDWYTGITIPHVLLDELLHPLPVSADLPGPHGVVRPAGAISVEQSLHAELSTHPGLEKSQRAGQATKHRHADVHNAGKNAAGEVARAISPELVGSPEAIDGVFPQEDRLGPVRPAPNSPADVADKRRVPGAKDGLHLMNVAASQAGADSNAGRLAASGNETWRARWTRAIVPQRCDLEVLLQVIDPDHTYYRMYLYSAVHCHQKSLDRSLEIGNGQGIVPGSPHHDP